MTVYLFGANTVTLEILENPNWGPEQDVAVLVDGGSKPSDIGDVAPILHFDSVTLNPPDQVINCVGYRDLLSRERVALRSQIASHIASYISPFARVARTASIERGSVILGDAVVERGGVVGEGCLVWGGARICHDVRVGPYNFVAAGVKIGGFAVTGRYCKFGFNSVVEQNAVVPDSSSLGALRFYKRDGQIF